MVPRRDGELPATVPTSQTPEEVPLHVVDALQEDLDPRHAPRFPRSEFELSVQNRFDALDSTARDSSGLRPTSVDGSGVDIFPMTDDAALQVPVEPVRRRPCRRLVLIPQSQGTPHSIQDRHDVSEDEARHVVPQDPNSSDAESVDQMPVGEDDREGLSEVEGEEEEFVPERAPVDIDVRARTIAVGMASGHGGHARGVPAACSGDADRASVSQRCIQGSIPGCFGRKTLGRSKWGFHQGPAGMEVVHASAQNDLVSTTSRRQSPPEAVGRTVPSIRPWRLDVFGETEHAGR